MMKKYLEEYFGEELSLPSLFLLILLNNLRTLALGVSIPFVGQISVPIINGIILGIVFSIPLMELNPTIAQICSSLSESQDLILKLALTIPHGVIEFSAIILGCASALYFWSILIRWVISKSIDIRQIATRFLRHLIISVTLLIIAALIEVTITPLVAFIVQMGIC